MPTRNLLGFFVAALGGMVVLAHRKKGPSRVKLDKMAAERLSLSDGERLRADYEKVGNDIRKAIRQQHHV